MALATLFGAALILAAASMPESAADPVAVALTGRLACAEPNATKKTCGALVGYTRRRDGSVEWRAEALLGEDPALSFRTRSVGQVRSRAVCEIVLSDHIEAVEFLADGHPVSEPVSERARDVLYHALADFIGQEVCTSFVANGSSLRMVLTVNGRELPQYSHPMIWVDPNDGYSVKP